jgi:WD40 repeat protein
MNKENTMSSLTLPPLSGALYKPPIANKMVNTMKNDQARNMLLALVRQHGVDMCLDAQMCEHLIRQHYGKQHKHEVFALIQTLRHGLVKQLINAPPSLSKKTLLARLVRKLNSALGMEQSLAIWVAYTWAIALGLVTQPLATHDIAPPKAKPKKPARTAPTRLEPRPTTQSLGEKIHSVPNEGGDGAEVKLRSRILCTFQGDINNALHFDKDGKTLVNEAETMHLLNSSMRSQQSNETSVTAICYSHNGKLLASGSWNTRISVRDVETGNVLYTLIGHTHKISSLAFSPDDSMLASASWDGDARLWNTKHGKLIKTLNHANKRLFHITFSPNGRLLASGGEDGLLRIWDVDKLTSFLHRLWGSRTLRILRGHRGSIIAVAFTPDERFMISGSIDGTVRIWGQPDVNGVWRLFSMLRGTQTLHRLIHNGDVTALALSPDGETIAVGTSDKEIHLWDTQSGQHLRVLKGHEHWVSSLTFNPEGKVLASGGADQAIKLWDVSNGELLRTIYQEGYRVTSVGFNAEGEIVTSGSFDKTMVLDLAAG